MLALLLATVVAPSPVRPELVEGRPAIGSGGRPLTSSGRTEGGTAIEAERAFAADAHKLGQWTAFRKWAVPDAMMFMPRPVKAQEWLKGRSDPPKAIDWWPTESFVSCDGSLAVNTGGWRRSDGSVGYFTTVWKRQPDGGWRWTLDSGDTLRVARLRPGSPKTSRAKCGKKPLWEGIDIDGLTGSGASDDASLVYRWAARTDGAREVQVLSWDGRGWKSVLRNLVVVPSR